MAALLDDVVGDLVPLLGPPRGEPEVLAGGMTNANYRVQLGGGEYVVRLPGPGSGALGIDRATEHAAAVAAAQAGVGPDVLAFERGCLVTRFIPGRPLEPHEVRTPPHLGEVAAALRAFHAGPPLPTRFVVFRIVEEHLAAALAHGGAEPPEYAPLHALAARIEAALTHPEHALVPCHDDLLNANLIHDGTRLWLVDWDYAGMGDRFFDLANLAVNNGFEAADEIALLEAYFGPAEATPRRLAALRLQRLMSDFREAMWGVVQATASDLDVDYRAYAAQHFARLESAIAASPVDDWIAEAARGA